MDTVETQHSNQVVASAGAPIKVPPATKSMPKWEETARERLKAGIRKLSKPLAALVQKDANEGDTRVLVTAFLYEALGYDQFEDLTMEYQVKGEFADYGVRIDKELIAFIEVKRAMTKLAPKHLRQVEMYAVNEGVEWLILTNGAHWQVYHLSPGLPVQIDLALDADLLNEATITQKTNELFYLTRESLKKRQIDALWKAKRATSPKSLAKVVMTDAVVEAIRRELRRSTGQKVESPQVKKLLKETVLKSDCFE